MPTCRRCTTRTEACVCCAEVAGVGGVSGFWSLVGPGATTDSGSWWVCCASVGGLRRLVFGLVPSLAGVRVPTHVRGGFVPHPCGPVPFLCMPKEKEPKERAPHRPRSRAVGARLRAGATGVCRQCIRALTANAARSLAPPLRACPSPPRRGQRGIWPACKDSGCTHGVGLGAQERAAFPPARRRRRTAAEAARRDAERTHHGRESVFAKTQPGFAERGLGDVTARAWARRSALLFPPGPSAATDGGRSGPQGEREGSRSLRRQHTEVLSAQPAAGSGPCAQEVRKAAP